MKTYCQLKFKSNVLEKIFQEFRNNIMGKFLKNLSSVWNF